MRNTCAMPSKRLAGAKRALDLGFAALVIAVGAFVTWSALA
jgi:hypothetical protein